MPPLNPTYLKNTCHSYFYNSYKYFTIVLLASRLQYFKALRYDFLKIYCAPFGIIFLSLLFIPLLYLLVHNAWGIYFYRILPIIGPFTSLVFLIDANIYGKIIFSIVLISISTVYYLYYYVGDLEKASKMLLKASREVHNIFHIVFITYLVTFCVFVVYLYFLLFTEVKIFLANEMTFVGNNFIFFIIDLFHCYWTVYILIFSANFFLLSYLNNTIVSTIDMTTFPVLRPSFNYLEDNISNIVFCAVKSKVNATNNIQLVSNEVMNVLMYIPMCFNMVMMPYTTRNVWIIPLIMLLNRCGCSFLRSEILSQNINERLRGVSFYSLSFRYFLTSSFIVYLYTLMTYFNPSLCIWDLWGDFKLLIFVIGMVVFPNALMYYFLENSWRVMLLYTCYNSKEMNKYDHDFVDYMEKEIFIDPINNNE